jgi:hypothetical protein
VARSPDADVSLAVFQREGITIEDEVYCEAQARRVLLSVGVPRSVEQLPVTRRPKW